MEAVEMAEQLRKPALLAEALIRLSVVLLHDAGRSREMAMRAREIYETLGDIRGQARAQNTVAAIDNISGRVSDAHAAFEEAISMSKVAGMPDVRGAAALNLGTLILKTGDFARARDLYAESLTSFAEVKNSAYQVIALFNMAGCEREQGQWSSALELYATTSSLAERIGHGDLEIGSAAGSGLCLLELNATEKAREAEAEVRAKLDRRPEWFQNREVAEALIVRIAALDRNSDRAFSRFEWVLGMAEEADPYAVAWLLLACGAPLFEVDGGRMHEIIVRYAGKVKELGLPEVTRRFNDLAAMSVKSVKSLA
jgi:tetratricopeptide (TPR) repeat protein